MFLGAKYARISAKGTKIAKLAEPTSIYTLPWLFTTTAKETTYSLAVSIWPPGKFGFVVVTMLWSSIKHDSS
jgi:hypothetical protein